MHPGEMKQRVQFITDPAPVDDGAGGTVEQAPVLITEVWMKFQPVKGRRMLEYGDLGVINAWEGVCLWRKDLADERPKRMRFEGKDFAIHSMIEGERRKYLEIIAYRES